jgi:hypothetical protein
MLLTCALVGWAAMAPGAAARQPTEANVPTAGVQLSAPVERASATALGAQPQTSGTIPQRLEPLLPEPPQVESIPPLVDRIVHAPLRAPMTPAQSGVEIPSIGTQLESKPLPSLSVEGITTGFDGLDDTDNSLPTEPPDTQVAVGPNHIVEMTNSMGRVTTKSGQPLVNFSLRDFFNLPPTDGESDPRIIYDALSNRWIAVYLGFGVLDTNIYMAVSSTDDPTGTWCKSAIPGTGFYPIADQPAVGVTDDKVTVSVNFFEAEGGLFDGEQTAVLQKSDMLSCSGTRCFPRGLHPGAPRGQPGTCRRGPTSTWPNSPGNRPISFASTR